jgi:hypothetical protein
MSILITLNDFWFLSGFTSIAIPQQDRHLNKALRVLWFLSGLTTKCLSCWGIVIYVNPDKNHKPLNVMLECLSCWCIAIDVNPENNHKPLNVWFLSGYTSIAIPRQDRHFNITLRSLWFLSGFTYIAIPQQDRHFNIGKS